MKSIKQVRKEVSSVTGLRQLVVWDDDVPRHVNISIGRMPLTAATITISREEAAELGHALVRLYGE